VNWIAEYGNICCISLTPHTPTICFTLGIRLQRRSTPILCNQAEGTTYPHNIDTVPLHEPPKALFLPHSHQARPHGAVSLPACTCSCSCLRCCLHLSVSMSATCHTPMGCTVSCCPVTPHHSPAQVNLTGPSPQFSSQRLPTPSTCQCQLNRIGTALTI
jgi:hypothetical protein